MDEVGAIRYLLQLQDFATRDPVNYARWFVQNSGLTPEQLGFSSRQANPPQPDPKPAASTGNAELDKLLEDPGVAQLRSQFGQFSQAALGKIQQLEHYISQQEQAKQHYARQQHNTAVQSLQKQWQDFRVMQDDHGQLKYAHADNLQKQMGAIMDTDPQIASMPDGPAKLEAAYQAALWARPDLRTGLIEQERARAAAEAQKKTEAERAKAAARVQPAKGASTMPAKKGGLDAALDAAFASVGMRD
jgi:hypothetical protein